MSDVNPTLRRQIADAILDTTSDAIVACDRAGVIRFWNPGAVRIFGFEVQEAVGQSLDVIIPERLRARHWAGYHKMVSTGQSRYNDGSVLAVPGRRKDGSQPSVEFTIIPLKDDHGEVLGLVAIMRDVTTRFDELKALRKQLSEKASR